MPPPVIPPSTGRSAPVMKDASGPSKRQLLPRLHPDWHHGTIILHPGCLQKYLLLQHHARHSVLMPLVFRPDPDKPNSHGLSDLQVPALLRGSVPVIPICCAISCAERCTYASPPLRSKASGCICTYLLTATAKPLICCCLSAGTRLPRDVFQESHCN